MRQLLIRRSSEGHAERSDQRKNVSRNFIMTSRRGMSKGIFPIPVDRPASVGLTAASPDFGHWLLLGNTVALSPLWGRLFVRVRLSAQQKTAPGAHQIRTRCGDRSVFCCRGRTFFEKSRSAGCLDSVFLAEGVESRPGYPVEEPSFGRMAVSIPGRQGFANRFFAARTAAAKGPASGTPHQRGIPKNLSLYHRGRDLHHKAVRGRKSKGKGPLSRRPKVRGKAGGSASPKISRRGGIPLPRPML